MTDGDRNESAGTLSAEDLECVVLPAREGQTPCGASPVRIFLGTEPAQYRANRAFVRSIEAVRDPAREYRIYLMSEMPGFDRRGWTTGFTNYRFAIPHLAGQTGRAIYNDEDELYFVDPGVLFDQPMGEAGYLAISDTESSVMLIDCARMAAVWTLEGARHEWKRKLLRRANAAGLRGDLDPGWNARDEEFEPGRSSLIHYTTLHTQPWRPFPERFVYDDGAHTDLWHEVEARAIDEGFELFTPTSPSRGYAAFAARVAEGPPERLRTRVETAGVLGRRLDALAREVKARHLLEVDVSVRGRGEMRPGRFGLDEERIRGLAEWGGELEDGERYDGVVCAAGLADAPVWDVPWIVERLFESSRRFVLAGVPCPEAPPKRHWLVPPQGTVHTPGWWRSHFEAASHRHPEVRWELITARGGRFEPEAVEVHHGGRWQSGSPPVVWLLQEERSPASEEALALAESLGWPYRPMPLRFGPAAELPSAWLGSSLRGLADGGRALLDAGRAGWPDLVIAGGRRTAPVARAIKAATHGRTRLVQIGAKGASPPEPFDLGIVPSSAGLFPHPQRVETPLPLVPRRARATRDALVRHAVSIAEDPAPRLLVLVGGDGRTRTLDTHAAAALAVAVRSAAERSGASLWVSVGPRVGDRVFAAIDRALAGVAWLHRCAPGQSEEESPYRAWLASADRIVVTSESDHLLAEALETGCPIHVYELPERPPSAPSAIANRLVDRIAARAVARPENDRGTTRPQAGLEWLAARWVANGVVRPLPQREALHAKLAAEGRLLPFDALATWAASGADPEPVAIAASPAEGSASATGRTSDVMPGLVRRVRSLLGQPVADA